MGVKVAIIKEKASKLLCLSVNNRICYLDLNWAEWLYLVLRCSVFDLFLQKLLNFHVVKCYPMLPNIALVREIIRENFSTAQWESLFAAVELDLAAAGPWEPLIQKMAYGGTSMILSSFYRLADF